MGLEQVVESGGGSVSSSSSSGGGSNSKDEIVKDVGSEPYRKKFREEKWKGVKQVILDETEYTVGEVLSMPNQKRHDVLHEAALIHERKKAPSESEYETSNRCFVCEKDCTDVSVEIEGYTVCVSHPAGRVRKEIDDHEQ